MIQGLKNIQSEMGGEMEGFCLALETHHIQTSRKCHSSPPPPLTDAFFIL